VAPIYSQFTMSLKKICKRTMLLIFYRLNSFSDTSLLYLGNFHLKIVSA